jgi:dipeptidyl aminopeptidase/acylaminoacyl peptidase
MQVHIWPAIPVPLLLSSKENTFGLFSEALTSLWQIIQERSSNNSRTLPVTMPKPPFHQKEIRSFLPASADGKKLVFRSSRPTTEEEVKEYKELLAQGLVAPTKMEIYTCNVDGSDLKQITNLGKANWAPYFHPNGKKIIFSSNHHSQKGYDFQLFSVNIDGTGVEQITNESMFNAFPMFSPDGKKLIFSSNRKNHGTRDTNLFIADWVD